VWADGRHPVGYLSRDDAARYARQLDALDKGTYLMADARVWIAKDADGRVWGSVKVFVPEPDGLMPFNDLPEEPHAVLPSGRAIHVQGEENHMDVLRRFALGSAPRHIAATLHVVEVQKSEKGPKQPTLQVRIDEQPVGTLTKAMGDQVRDLVGFVNEQGRIPVVRAVIKGSTLRADVTLYVARTVDVPRRWLDSISQSS
jgi:hypothetical protein